MKLADVARPGSQVPELGCDGPGLQYLEGHCNQDDAVHPGHVLREHGRRRVPGRVGAPDGRTGHEAQPGANRFGESCGCAAGRARWSAISRTGRSLQQQSSPHGATRIPDSTTQPHSAQPICTPTSIGAFDAAAAGIAHSAGLRSRSIGPFVPGRTQPCRGTVAQDTGAPGS